MLLNVNDNNPSSKHYINQFESVNTIQYKVYQYLMNVNQSVFYF